MRNLRAEIAGLSLLCAVSLLGAAPQVILPGGKLLGTDRLKENARISFVKLDEALKNSQLQPEGRIPAAWTGSRPAAKGKVFVTLSVFADAGRIIGTQDYLLTADGSSFPCLGISPAPGQPYDLRQLAFKGPGEIKMIFEIPATVQNLTLKSAYSKIPLPAIPIVLQLPPPPVKKAVVPPAAGKTAPAQKAPAVKKTAPAQKASAVKKAAPAKKAPAVKKAAPAKKAPAVKKAAPAKKAAESPKAAKKSKAVKKADQKKKK